ncbi:MAG: helix-turn-helix domain-containing protein [FCB group bacterium]|jgi:DNA-binding NtrC family response regulator|nr:helix-turn-helix domain-containing protein [FCB group bacterium]
MARVELAITDPASRLTLKAMLEAEGHTVTEAEPEVVICDDVPTAVQRSSERPVLVLAPYAEVRDAVAAMRQGVYGYILLPFQAGEAALMVERALGRNHSAPEHEAPQKLEEVEFKHIQEVLRLCKGNRAEAARVLGIGRNTLWRKLKKIGGAENGEVGDEEEDEDPTE